MQKSFPRTFWTVLGLSAFAVCGGQADVMHHHDFPPNWIGDTLSADVVLTAAAPGPNYVLYGDLTVLPGVTLVVEPGVTIMAVHNSDFFYSNDPTKAEIVVHGVLQAIGTSASPITFSSDDITGLIPGAASLSRRVDSST